MPDAVDEAEKVIEADCILTLYELPDASDGPWLAAASESNEPRRSCGATEQASDGVQIGTTKIFPNACEIMHGEVLLHIQLAQHCARAIFEPSEGCKPII